MKLFYVLNLLLQVKKLYVGQNGILSTPAVSCIIRKKAASGGFILSASHNPGGPNGDFGIKFNTANGGPAPTDVTERIFKLTETIGEYRICQDLECDVSKVGVNNYVVDSSDFEVEVIDSMKVTEVDNNQNILTYELLNDEKKIYL